MSLSIAGGSCIMEGYRYCTLGADCAWLRRRVTLARVHWASSQLAKLPYFAALSCLVSPFAYIR